jgi:hypothetical protein
MYGLHKAFLAEMAKAPAALLSKFISEKLAAEGHAERPGFVEALTKHLLGGGTEPFDWDDGSGDDVIIAFTDADTKKLDELTKEFVSALPDVVTQISSEAAKAILKALKRDWPGQAEFERESLQGFRRRLEARWGKGFDGLRMLLTMVREMGGEVHARARRSRSSKNQAIRSILLRLHTRACQVTAEIITLMENGFADGAMARWRTLYEIGVVATVISDGGDELAQRYMAHEAVESKLAFDEYDRCHQALGFKPMSLKERRRVERAFKAAVNAHGPEFGKPYGWAAQHLGLKRVTFKELEDAADRSEMRSYYKMASYNVHADAKGVFHRLGVLGDPWMVIAGASDAGFVDPGQNTAITLVQITALLFRDRISNLDIMIRMQLLILVRDEIPGALEKASRSFDRDHARLQAEEKHKRARKTS